MEKTLYLQLRRQIKLEKKWRPLINHLIVDFTLLFLGALCISKGAYLGLVLLVPVLLFRNFSLMHDATHSAIADNRMINDAIGEWAGCLCLLPFQAWKQSHLKHHFWSGNLVEDPVMAWRVQLPKSPVWFQNFLTWGWRHWIPILAFLQYTLFWKLAIQQGLQSKSVGDWIKLSFPILFWTGILVYGGGSFFLLALCPALYIYLLAVEVVNFPHHLHLSVLEGEARAPIWEQHETARSCLYPKWFSRNFVLNFNLHTEHHMFPDAPWYHLEQIQGPLREALGAQYNYDIGINWVLKYRSASLLEIILPPQKKLEKPLKQSG